MATPTKLIDKALASAAAIPSSRKNSARVALINVKDSARIVLSECFRQFGIGTVLMTEHAAERLRKEKFEACALKLDGDAETIMESARTSRSNSRMVIYGRGNFFCIADSSAHLGSRGCQLAQTQQELRAAF